MLVRGGADGCAGPEHAASTKAAPSPRATGTSRDLVREARVSDPALEPRRPAVHRASPGPAVTVANGSGPFRTVTRPWHREPQRGGSGSRDPAPVDRALTRPWAQFGPTPVASVGLSTVFAPARREFDAGCGRHPGACTGISRWGASSGEEADVCDDGGGWRARRGLRPRGECVPPAQSAQDHGRHDGERGCLQHHRQPGPALRDEPGQRLRLGHAVLRPDPWEPPELPRHRLGLGPGRHRRQPALGPQLPGRSDTRQPAGGGGGQHGRLRREPSR